jgi:hypothetical protein
VDPTANRVVLRPRFFDRECVFLLVTPALGSLLLAVMLALHSPQPETIHCERATQQCTYFFPGFRTGDTYTNALADWKSSKVIHDKQGGASWKVERRQGPLWLGSQQGDQATMALYAKLSADLQAFIDDPNRPTFDAMLPPSKVTYVAFALIFPFGLLLGFFGFRWWRGWYAELELDPHKRTITIHRRPMFFTGPRTLEKPVSELRLSEDVERRNIGKGQSAKFARFELWDTRGKRVFKYLTLYDNKSRAQLDADMKLLSDFVQRS